MTLRSPRAPASRRGARRPRPRPGPRAWALVALLAPALALPGLAGLGAPAANPVTRDSASPGSAPPTEARPRIQNLAPAGRLQTGFDAVPASAGRGLPFTNRVSAAASGNNQILENGAGVALGDVNGDGGCDVYLCGSEPANALFLNLGDWRFADITAEAGVACERQFSTGAALADLDGDRDLDLLVNGLGVGTRLFRNDGRGRFTEELRSGLDRRAAATSLGLADIDRDGDLDLYVATYRTLSARYEVPPPAVEVRRVQGRLAVSPADRFVAFPLTDGRVELAERGEPDTLYLNDGNGRFQAVSWTDGTFRDESGQPLAEAPAEWGLSVLVRDLDGNGSPDLYVCNDFFRSRDQFWLNDGSGRFHAAPRTAWRSLSLSSMAADAADLDRDGHDDLVVTEMLARSHPTRQRQRANAFRPEQALPFADPGYQPEVPRNTLFRARGDGTFAEISQFAGLAATDWTWNIALTDIDLDGFEDVLVATGNAHDVLDLDAQDELDRAARRGPVRMLDFYRPLPQRMLAFRNRGNLTFEETGARWGLSEPGIAQGMALGDLDRDGDLDVVVNRLNQPVLLLRNRSAEPRLAVRLVGRAPNTAALGARLILRPENPAPGPEGLAQSRVLVAGGRYLSSDEALASFAARPSLGSLSLEVRWPSGARTRSPGLQAGQLVEIEEPLVPPAAPPPPTPPPGPPPLFADATPLLLHRHQDAGFDDFARQPLLPHRLSHLGPGVAWADLDGDAWEDVVVSGGAGGRLALLRNERGTRFSPVPLPDPPAPSAAREQSAPVLGRLPDGTPALWVGTPRYDDPAAIGAPLLALTPATPAGTWTHPLPPLEASTGPLCVADVDGDGDLDLFVGARCLPGRFPLPAPSLIYRQEAGRWVEDPAARAALAHAGMVSGALFTDLDGDADPDLVLACEWGSLRVFRNDRGPWAERTRELGLDAWTGCWAGVTAADFDGDGRLDLAASNLGLNTRHQLAPDRPWRLYAGDFSGAGNGGPDLVEACYVPELRDYAPWRALDVLGRSIPAWPPRFPNREAFARTPVDTLLGEARDRSRVLEAATLEHRIFLNRGDRFESRPLPPEAQWAPGFGLAVADFDGDAAEDLFLAQNWFDLDLDSTRADAGTGLVLLGDGRGGFRPLNPVESGFALHGQQRGAAVADFDHDGRPDLLVTQNHEATRLLRNQSGLPGLRVRLRGPVPNPDGIGALLRLVQDGREGPVREVRAGGGYWSSDAPVHVLARRPGPARLRVRWPGGAISDTGIAPGVNEVTVAAEAPRPNP